MAKTEETVSPYREARAMIVDRLRWDLKPESWRSRRRLRALKDRHQGEKVILCNGPSLLESDLGLLDGVHTFGLNKINLLFDRSSFRPSAIVAVNPLVLEQNAEFYRTTPLPLFLDRAGLRHVPPRENVAFLHSSSQQRFAGDCFMELAAFVAA